MGHKEDSRSSFYTVHGIIFNYSCAENIFEWDTLTCRLRAGHSYERSSLQVVIDFPKERF